MCQPFGSLNDGPSCSTACAMSATTVVATIPIRIPPGTFRATRMPMTTTPSRKISVGTDVMDPPSPSCTGGPPCVRFTKPESTKPMNAMNRPMPTVIAAFSGCGTAWKIAVRMPVAPNSTMSTPLITTRPIASGQVTWPTTETARKELMPRPAASANGSRAMRPNRIVMTPAVRPVAAPICAACSAWWATSLVPPRISGLRITM